uniref:Uncharacterized protein n=1 Tax=Arundo donax TaxID=35708 RepID=A0A0A9AXP1_ARUDO
MWHWILYHGNQPGYNLHIEQMVPADFISLISHDPHKVVSVRENLLTLQQIQCCSMP